jgi:hypothetical protein
MPQMVQIRFQWKDDGNPPQTQNHKITASIEDALGELVAGLTNDVIPTLGPDLQLSINTQATGELRGTPG